MPEETDGGKIGDSMQELVSARGDKVSIHTQECILWKLEHSNCFGCPSELGCGKVVHLMLLMMLPMMYKPSNFEDFQKMQQRITELQDRVLQAQTADELKEIPTA